MSEAYRLFVLNAERERKARGMSREDVAAKLGVTRQAVDPVLTGRECPTMDRADRIADAIGVPLYQLLSRQVHRKAK